MIKRTPLVLGALLAVWVVIVGWQIAEHRRVTEAARTELLNRARALATPLRGVIQALGRGPSGRLVEQERLETALKGLVAEGDVISIALLNAAGDILVTAGVPIVDPKMIGRMKSRELWDPSNLTVVRWVDLGGSESPEGETNRPPFVFPGPTRDRQRPPGEGSTNASVDTARAMVAAGYSNAPGPATNLLAGEASTNSAGPRGRIGGPGRRGLAPWMMSEEERQQRGLHGLVVVVPREGEQQISRQDSWIRIIIACLASISVVGIGMAWRSVARSQELQIRLVRTSELNTHLREMNLAAAGLAHETRNPLNIIRGLAQLISKQKDASPETSRKLLDIVHETDRVTAQLNEFINYSKPREVRRTAVALGSVVNEVVRALSYDIEEKLIHLQVKGGPMTIEADEQLLRQALFNLLLNSTQAVEAGGEIEVEVLKRNGSDAIIEVRDNGPGVPPERRTEVFKPYFTTHQKGTGLGLAVVQQIVLAHGWDIECLPNEPHGAIFRISHLKVAAQN